MMVHIHVGMSGVACPDCQHFACVCVIKERHEPDCSFRISATCAVPIECDHGYDTCPICDQCNCGAGVAKEDFGGDTDWYERKDEYEAS